jgi:hypothetical protein
VLAARAIPHACIELDALACSWPARGHYNEDAALENLAAVWANFRAAGAECLVVGGVMERAADLEGVRGAVPGARITVCRLVASEATRLARVRERERGGGLDWHLHRTVELDRILDANGLEDFTVVNEDQPLRRVAEEVLVRAGWIEASAARLPGDE